MRISVVIPVYNEEKYIRRCLEALQSGKRMPDEIIVVDGGSTDCTVEIAKKKGAVVLDNPRKNAACGRNIGILRAKGDVVAFTDGDCMVHPEWLEAIETSFRDPSVDGVGGKVVAAVPENDIEAYWNHLQLEIVMKFGNDGYQVKERTLNDSFITANCAYRRKFLWKMKGFNRWFANNGEDVELSWRALAKGAKLLYVPEAVVDYHGVTDIEGIRKKSFRNGVASSKLQKVYGGKINYDINIYKIWFASFKGTLLRKKWEKYNLIETTCHLLGKYYGSIIAGVINV